MVFTVSRTRGRYTHFLLEDRAVVEMSHRRTPSCLPGTLDDLLAEQLRHERPKADDVGNGAAVLPSPAQPRAFHSNVTGRGKTGPPGGPSPGRRVVSGSGGLNGNRSTGRATWNAYFRIFGRADRISSTSFSFRSPFL